MSVAAALESDLEPFSKLQRFELNAEVSFVPSLLLFQKTHLIRRPPNFI